MTSTVYPSKEDLQSYKRSEVQALCKEHSLRAIGTTESMRESLINYFDTQTAAKSLEKKNIPRTRTISARTIPSKPASARPAVAPIEESGGDKATARVIKSSLTTVPRLRLQSAALPRTAPIRPRVSSASASSGSPMQTDSDGTPTTAPSSVDLQLLSPPSTKPRTLNPSGEAMPPPFIKRKISGNLASSVSSTATTVPKPRLASKASSESLSISQNASRRVSGGGIAFPSKGPPSVSSRRVSLAPSITPTPTPPLKSASRPSPSVTIGALQAQLAELSTAFKAQTERIDEQEKLIQSQQALIKALQDSAKETHELVTTTHTEVLEGCRVDVASCRDEYSFLKMALSGMDKRVSTVEKDVLSEDGRVERLIKEIGDVDIAMASERDRVSTIEDKVDQMASKLEESSSPTGSVRQKTVSLVRKRKPSAVDGNHSPADSLGGYQRDRRLSRASISASIHALPPPSQITSSAPANTVTFPHGRFQSKPFTGQKQDFKFPPSGASNRHSMSSFNNARTRSTPTYDHDKDNIDESDLAELFNKMGTDEDDDPMGTTEADGDGDEDEPPAPPPQRRASTKRTPPTIKIKRAAASPDVNMSAIESSNTDAVSVSISDLDIPRPADDDDFSLMHQPQPSFGFATTDDEEIPPPTARQFRRSP